ncbi:MAG: hypothetical protein HFI65_03705 [Lachnospiraceae bacterium]|nr:hypothetical protein [Lachnospiraceae bacterium]
MEVKLPAMGGAAKSLKANVSEEERCRGFRGQSSEKSRSSFVISHILLDNRPLPIYNNMACAKTMLFLVRENRSLPNITGGEKHAHIQPVSEKG